MKSHQHAISALPSVVEHRRSIKSVATTVSAVLVLTLGGCAATVQRSAGDGLTAAQSVSGALPSMNLPVQGSKRLVLNMQLAPEHPKDSGWDGFRKEWHDITAEQAKAQGVAFSTQDGAATPTGEAGTLAVVYVRDYRHVGVGQRILLGIMTGNAYIDAKVEYRDLATGKLYGERNYNTSSSAGYGVAAPVTPKQIYALADEILFEMKRP